MSFKHILAVLLVLSIALTSAYAYEGCQPSFGCGGSMGTKAGQAHDCWMEVSAPCDTIDGNTIYSCTEKTAADALCKFMCNTAGSAWQGQFPQQCTAGTDPDDRCLVSDECTTPATEFTVTTSPLSGISPGNDIEIDFDVGSNNLNVPDFVMFVYVPWIGSDNCGTNIETVTIDGTEYPTEYNDWYGDCAAIITGAMAERISAGTLNTGGPTSLTMSITTDYATAGTESYIEIYTLYNANPVGDGTMLGYGYLDVGFAGSNHCTNLAKDSDETDVDCGGSLCSGCANGKDCLTTADCNPGSCNPETLKCIDRCTNGERDGGESDVDCGGSCTKCTVDKSCNYASDCASGLTCKLTHCSVLTSNPCTTGLKDFGESGIDCGGTSSCAKCGDGFGCLLDSDCVSGYCNNRLCAASGDRNVGNMYDIYPQSNPYQLYIYGDLHVGQMFSSKSDVYLVNGGVSYLMVRSDDVSGTVSNFDLSNLDVQTSSSATGDTVFVEGLPNPHATYGIYKDLLIPAGDASFAFCCPLAQSIGEVVPGCSNMFITTDIVPGAVGGLYFVCSGMEGSGGSTQGDTNITINDSAEGSTALPNSLVTFNAYFYNKTIGVGDTTLDDTNVNCTAEIDGTNYTMNYVSADKRWNATYSYTTTGTKWWTVWCDTNATGHFDLSASDTVDIANAAYPEFSDFAWVLAAVLGAGGFFLIRRKGSF